MPGTYTDTVNHLRGQIAPTAEKLAATVLLI